MRTRIAIQIGLLFLSLALPAASRSAQQSNGYGPEVKSFLDLMRHEEDELEYQILHNEISRPHYVRAKSRLAIHRQAVLNMVKETGEDVVPELHVVTAAELDELIEQGARALRGVKRGSLINGKWRYIGSVTKGQVFYIFERIQKP
ncbi:MAG: hypothetical protein V7641_669 [Blastocatellia bacterium]